MKRLLLAVVLGVVGLMLTPAAASAQFRPHPFGPSLRPLPSLSPLNSLPSLGALSRIPNPYAFIPRIQVGLPLSGGLVLNTRQIAINNMAYNYYYASAYYTSAYFASGTYGMYGQSGSYMTGGTLGRPDLVQAAQREITKAQRDASLPGARDLISGPSNYEKGTAPALPDGGLQGQPDVLRKALAASNPAEVASGESLNELFKEIVRVEAKGAKGPSAYIPSLLLDDMRFMGSPAADLLNFARQAGSLPFPAAFDDPVLAALREDLEKDFAAAAVAVQAGKSPEMAKLTKLEVTFQRLQDAAGPVIKNLPFEDARRFLNRMAGAIRGMKGNTAIALIDPKWAAEGLTVAELVKHMTRHKVFFGPAPSGNEESYMTMHRNFVTYLFVLTQPKK
jgi:hypothetical protein